MKLDGSLHDLGFTRCASEHGMYTRGVAKSRVVVAVFLGSGVGRRRAEDVRGGGVQVVVLGVEAPGGVQAMNKHALLMITTYVCGILIEQIFITHVDVDCEGSVIQALHA
ncbi:hypothetical protein E2562_030715 [Oryza meyeriana var. granulata]|uniref:Uncharacterized protein n=1 Tax=Oryza meyeriana var. granulata TaxID=110450 RepID=A0A6G1CVB0_9ORYZ|nr:hypothetical protein E2562_030715 [Oryza meyeriana var. granulata]